MATDPEAKRRIAEIGYSKPKDDFVDVAVVDLDSLETIETRRVPRSEFFGSAFLSRSSSEEPKPADCQEDTQPPVGAESS